MSDKTREVHTFEINPKQNRNFTVCFEVVYSKEYSYYNIKDKTEHIGKGLYMRVKFPIKFGSTFYNVPLKTMNRFSQKTFDNFEVPTELLDEHKRRVKTIVDKEFK